MSAPDLAWLREVPLAHRGLHGAGVPENSLAAFAAARRAGVGVELDVQRTADGVPVVLHDPDLSRVAADPRRIEDVSLAELAQLRLDGTDERIPTLLDVLDVLVDTPVMVEIKNLQGRPGPLEPQVADLLRAHPGPACVAGFNPATIRWFARNAPEIVRVQTAGLLVDIPMPALMRWSLRTLRWLPMARPHAVSFEVHGLDGAAVRRYRAAGGIVIAWTVRDAELLDIATRLADNVIFEGLTPADVAAGRSTPARPTPGSG